MIGHPTSDDLVLHYYRESPQPTVLDAHLAECAGCRRSFEDLSLTLAKVTDETVTGGEAPEFGAEEAGRAWQRLAPRLEAERRRGAWRSARLLLPLAMAASLILAFSIGRRSPAPRSTSSPAAAPSGTDRIVLGAVGDHLERSEMLLVELSNAGPESETDSAQRQQQAEELVGANRLYRQSVARTGETGMATVLEELERLLVEVAHQPSLTPADVGQLQRRIEFLGLLFKVRVLGSEVREKQKEMGPMPVPVVS